MAGIKMTITEVQKHPADFLYIFADDKKFLPYIDLKHRAIIVGKRANQNKIILLSAQEYGSSRDEYVKAIREAFINIYGVTPAQALVTLAQGGEVAGKNWAKGVYGVGSTAITRKDFVQNPSITVNTETGEILKDGKVVSSTPAVYGRSLKGDAVAFNYSYTENGKTYTSQYNKALGKYYASAYATADVMQNADGKNITGADVSSNWENGILSIEKLGDWIMNLLEQLGLISTDDGRETISPANTLPSQTKDGFVAGVEKTETDWGTIGLVVLGGTLLATGAFSKFWKGALGSKKRRK